MKFGVGLPVVHLYPVTANQWEYTAPPSVATEIAQKADALGFDFLIIPEHIIIPNEMLETMGARYPDALAAMAFIAGATRNIKVLSYIMVLPYRNPIVAAKTIATMDFLSNGRVLVGTAVGHMQREFEILGVPFHERGKIMDEYLLAMKELWTQDSPTFEGRYVRFSDIRFEPKPIQKPHPPIWLGGNTKPAMRRAANLGDGWIPWLIGPEQMPQCLEYIFSQPGFQSRYPNGKGFDVIVPLARFQVEDYSHRELGPTVMPRGKEEIVEAIGQWKDVGVTGVVINFPRTRTPEQAMEWLEWYAKEIVPVFKNGS